MDLAAWGARRLDAVVVGITGSVGKTSTKDLAAAAIGAGRRVAANERSFNNEQGLPGHRARRRRRHRGARAGDGHARVRRDRPALRGRPADDRRRHRRRRRAHRPRRRHRRRRPGQGRARRGPAGTTAWRSSTPTTIGCVAMAPRRRRRRRSRSASRRRRRRASTRSTLDELARPSFRLRTPWGSADVQLARQRAAHGGQRRGGDRRRRRARGRRRCSGRDAVAGAELSASRMAVHRLRVGCRRHRRRLQRQPDVDGRRARRPGGDAGEPTRRRRRRDGRARRRPRRPTATSPTASASSGIELIAVGTDLYGVEPCADPVAAVGPLGPGTAVLVKASRVAGLDRVAAAARR